MAEKSETDGKVYTVQYFERAVFELHLRSSSLNQAPYNVLLSLLGSFRYKQKYPDGAPGQVPNNQANSRLFAETGKRVGGVFLDYWLRNGGLAQQGYPISDEFTEVSDLNGKPYKVQYFERAVFELHPENQRPYDVLLSQLGTMRYRAKAGLAQMPKGRLAFASKRDGNWEIYLMNADGSDQHRLTNDPAADRYPSWSPDGKQIAFYSNRGGSASIYVMDADGSNQQALARGREPAWSPDGRYIAFSSENAGVIYVMNADGSNIRQLSSGSSGGDAIPTWSPDSKRIAYMSSVIVGQTPGNTLLNEDVDVIDIDGRNHRKLTDRPGVDGLPAWAPDGRHIAFTSDRDGGPEIYVMDTDGSNVRRLAPGQGGAHPAWSPDGKYIAFVNEQERNNPDVFVMTADGASVWRLTHDRADDWLPAWAPAARTGTGSPHSIAIP
jgi:dipeptidyl aminopeptidase/acylaminoacyl peptidase